MSIHYKALIAEAQRLVGVPFMHQGRSVHGVDCIGMIVLAVKNAGLDPEAVAGFKDELDYGRVPNAELLTKLSRHLIRVRQAVPGVVVVFRFQGEKEPQHLAILTDKDSIVHSNAKQGRVVEHGYRGLWLRQTHSLWRIPGIAYDG